MNVVNPSRSSPELRSRGEQRVVNPDQWFLSDETLEELKRLATHSCVLCALEDMDDEEWDWSE